MSINDTPEIREIFGAFVQVAVETTYTIGVSNGQRAGELIIAGGASAIAALEQRLAA